MYIRPQSGEWPHWIIVEIIQTEFIQTKIVNWPMTSIIVIIDALGKKGQLNFICSLGA